MRIPEDKITEILNATDIVDLVSDAVTLKKSGKNYFGLCPFHSEKTPSFSVNPNKQIFYCFGCGAGGDAFSFLMKHQGVSFPEAATLLARKAGVMLENVALDPSQRKKLQIKEGVFRVNGAVRDFFCDQLQNSTGGAAARMYLTQRGMTPEMIAEFGIGFAPDAWDHVVRLLRKWKVSRGVAQASGLVLPRKKGNGYYDRFRNRIIFPIIDVNMQVSGFGGRVMDDAMPKYLNSPETLVYSKGKILYGLHAARQHCRQRGDVYIVEGYFDFLSLYQYGIKNCVATLGTALTSSHVRLLKGYASRMVLVFDSDDAGINAAARGVELFMKEGVDVRILVLPEGQDPDSFVSRFGKEAFEDAAKQSMSVMTFLTQTAIHRYGTSIEGKVAVLDDVSQYLASIHESTKRSLYIRDLSHRLGIDEKAVMEKVRQQREGQAKQLRQSFTRREKENSRHSFVGGGASDSFPDGEVNSIFMGDSLGGDGMGYNTDTSGAHHPHRPQERANAFCAEKREKQLLSMMIQFPDIIEDVKSRGVLDCFFSQHLKSIGERLVAVASISSDRLVAGIMSAMQSEDERELIASLAMDEFSDVDDLREKSIVLMNRLIHIRQKHENSLINEIRNQERHDAADIPLELLRQRQAEIRKLRGYE